MHNKTVHAAHPSYSKLNAICNEVPNNNIDFTNQLCDVFPLANQ